MNCAIYSLVVCWLVNEEANACDCDGDRMNYWPSCTAGSWRRLAVRSETDGRHGGSEVGTREGEGEGDVHGCYSAPTQRQRVREK